MLYEIDFTRTTDGLHDDFTWYMNGPAARYSARSGRREAPEVVTDFIEHYGMMNGAVQADVFECHLADVKRDGTRSHAWRSELTTLDLVPEGCTGHVTTVNDREGDSWTMLTHTWASTRPAPVLPRECPVHPHGDVGVPERHDDLRDVLGHPHAVVR